MIIVIFPFRPGDARPARRTHEVRGSFVCALCLSPLCLVRVPCPRIGRRIGLRHVTRQHPPESPCVRQIHFFTIRRRIFERSLEEQPQVGHTPAPRKTSVGSAASEPHRNSFSSFSWGRPCVRSPYVARDGQNKDEEERLDTGYVGKNTTWLDPLLVVYSLLL